PAMEADLIGLVYRNTRTSCRSLARLCAQISHDALRRVLYSSVPWSRRLWQGFTARVVRKGGYFIVDDTNWQRFNRVAEGGRWGMVGQRRQAGVGDAGGTIAVDRWVLEGTGRDPVGAGWGEVEGRTGCGAPVLRAAPGAYTPVRPL